MRAGAAVSTSMALRVGRSCEHGFAQRRAALSGDTALRMFLERAASWAANVAPDEVAASLGDTVSDVARSAISGESAAAPFEHGKCLASHIPGVHPPVLSDHGHLSLGADSLELLLDDLLTIAPA